MDWSIESVEQRLLGAKIDVIDFPAERIIEAVNRADKTLGTNWVASYPPAKGLVPTLRVIGAGLRLASLEGLAESEKLIDQIRRHDSSADAELTAIYLFRSVDPTVEMELYPAVGARRADFRMRRSTEQWTTVEVTCAAASKEEKRVHAILRRVTDALDRVDAQFALDVLLRREPTHDEISELCDHLPEFCRLPGQQRAELTNGAGFLLLNCAKIGQLLSPEIPELADVPKIGLAKFAGGGPGGAPHHQVAVSIPFSDERAERFLTAEAKQLPKDGLGLVMICGPTSRNEVNAWSRSIRRRFRPNMHTRISGVCLFGGGMVPAGSRYTWLAYGEILVNPHARVPLPDWIREAVISTSEAFRLAASQ